MNIIIVHIITHCIAVLLVAAGGRLVMAIDYTICSHGFFFAFAYMNGTMAYVHISGISHIMCCLIIVVWN